MKAESHFENIFTMICTTILVLGFYALKDPKVVTIKTATAYEIWANGEFLGNVYKHHTYGDWTAISRQTSRTHDSRLNACESLYRAINQ